MSRAVLLVATLAATALVWAAAASAPAAGEQPAGNEPAGREGARWHSYAVVVKQATAGDAQWQVVVAALCRKHDAVVITYDETVEQSLDALRKRFPRYTCFVAEPEEVGRDFVAQVHRLTRRLDDDPYTDTFWGILTGYDAANALAIAAHDEPLVVRKVAAGTEFAMDLVSEGVWYDELVKNKVVRKQPDGRPEEQRGPDDTTEALVETLNRYHPHLFITSGHATAPAWRGSACGRPRDHRESFRASDPNVSCAPAGCRYQPDGKSYRCARRRRCRQWSVVGS